MSNYQIKINTPSKSETVSLFDQFSLGSSHDSSHQVKSLLSKHFSFIMKDDALLLINYSESGTFLKNQELKAGKKYILENKDIIKTGDVEIIVEASLVKSNKAHSASSEMDISLDESDDLENEVEKEEDDDVDIDIDIDEKEDEEDLNENFFDLDVEDESPDKDPQPKAKDHESSQKIELDKSPGTSATVQTKPTNPTSHNIVNLSSSKPKTMGSLKNVLASKKQQPAMADLDLDDDDDLDDSDNQSSRESSVKNIHLSGAITRQALDHTNAKGTKLSFFQKLFGKKSKPASADETESSISLLKKPESNTKSHITTPSGLDLSRHHDLVKVLDEKRKQRSQHNGDLQPNNELTKSKKKGLLNFFKPHRKSSTPGVKPKRGFFRRLVYKLNIFKTNKIFQVGCKTRIYLFLATLSLLNVLGYQILPKQELNLSVETYVKQISTYVKKDYLTNNLIPRIEKAIPGFQIKAKRAEQDFISNATKLGQKTVAKIKENANELGITEAPVTTPPTPETLTSKPRKKRGVYNPKQNRPKQAPTIAQTPSIDHFSLSNFVLSNMQIILPQLREIIRKLGPTHDKYAEITTRFILIYLIYEIICNLLFGVSFLSFLYGIRIKGNFLWIRLKSVLRTFLFFIFIPLFFLTELSVCFKRRSLKEVLSFTSYEYNQFKLRQLLAITIIPIIIILPLITPLFRNMDASNNIFCTDYQLAPPFKISEGKKAQSLTADSLLTPHDFRLNVIGFDKEDVGLPNYFYVAPYINKKNKTIITGIYLYDYLIGDYAIMEKGPAYDFTNFLSKASSDNPLFNKLFPRLHEYQKKETLIPWSSEHSRELAELLQASVRLNFNIASMDDLLTRPHELMLSLFTYLKNYGPLINGYIEGRDELYKLFGNSTITFKFRSIHNDFLLYYFVDNEPLHYCLTPLKTIKGHFTCINTKDSLGDLNSFIENELLINTILEKDPSKILGDEFNAFDSSYYLATQASSSPPPAKHGQLLKYYQHFASNAYENGDPKFVNFTKKILTDNLRFLETLPPHQRTSTQEVINEIKNIHSKLKPKLKCQEDAHCFLNSIPECQRVETTLKHQTRKNNIKMFYEKKLYLLGQKNNRCHFIIQFASVKTEYDEETRLILKGAGKADSEIFEAVKADSKEYLAKQDKIYSCLMSTSEITDLYNQWRSNIYTPDDVRDCTIITEIDDNYE